MKADKDKGHEPGFISENEKLYRSLFENVHDGIYRSTPDGCILMANPALVKMLGYESDDDLKKLNIGKDIYNSASERDLFVKQIVIDGRLKDNELVLKRKDGSKITVLENSHAVYDNNGTLLFYEGTLTDITGIKHTEEALRESEDRYRSLLETHQDGLSLFDIQGRFIYFNSRKKMMLGYENDEELLKTNIFSIIHPDDRQRVRKLFMEFMKKGTIPRIEARVLRKDGSSFWAEFSASMLKDSSGKPFRIMDSMRDISERKQADEQLMLLKHSVDAHYDGAFWMDTENRFVYVNDAACRDTGYTRQELLGKDISFINPLGTKEVMKLIWDRLRKSGSFTAEAVHRRKNGTLYPVELVTSYINFGGKEYNCGFARDISDRKNSAEEMRLRLEQLRQIIDLVPSYIFAKDGDGKFLLANKALAEVFGLSTDEIQGKNDGDYGATKEQVRWYRKHDLDVIKNGIPVHIPEEQVLRKDGTLGWFQTVKIPYKHPGYDKPAILGVATEITERKKVEDELRKSELRFRKLFEAHSAVKLLIDPESGLIVDANRAASEFYGWPVPKLKKMKIGGISAYPANKIKANIKLTMKNSSAYFEAVHRLSNGSLRDVEIFASKVNIDDKNYLHSIIHDITDKKKILKDLIAAKEKAEESDMVKTAFLHNISHEIRTPMNAIVGFSSLLEGPGLSEKVRSQYINIISQSSNQLLSIITDIVDISNIETGHVKISADSIKINELIKKIHDQYRITSDEAKLTFRYVLPEKTSRLKIISDETKLVQIISNLLDNSFKFTNKGTIEFGYNVKGDFLEFFVIDTGAGIEKENVEKIFERFFQADSSSNQKTEGTGLGLSICKGYVELMGGKIWAESRYGKGSVFRFTIPALKKNSAR
ncbi:MAG: PAS domain S-box protein [Bacteroidales bacterium]|jgi:PAS domain S-box-containing protein